jgi:hypothetical protein
MVIKRPSKTLIFRYKRNCLWKGRYTLLKAKEKCFLTYIFEGVKLCVYKCPFDNHYHVGKISKNTYKRYKETIKNSRMTLAYYKG